MNIIKYILIVLVIFGAVSCDNARKDSYGIPEITPPNIRFDVVTIGETNKKSFTITNVGKLEKGILEVRSIKLNRNNQFYKIDDIEPFKLKSGEKRVIDVSYTATNSDQEDITGKIDIEFFNSTINKKTVILYANKANAQIELSHDAIIFDSDKEENIFELTIKNIGTSELIFEGKDEDDHEYSGKNAIHFGNGTSNAFELLDLDNVRTLSPYKIENGEEIYDSFKIRVKYNKTGNSDTGTLEIFNNSINSPNKKVINIMANSIDCKLLIQPKERYIDFGIRPIGLEGADTILLANVGGKDCHVSKIYLSEVTANEFRIELEDGITLDQPLVIKPASRFKVFVYFKSTPQTGSGGAAGSVVIEADDNSWEDGKMKVDLFGASKDKEAPICIIKAINGADPIFEVEPGQIEAVNCIREGESVSVCSNVQMKSDSIDPKGEKLSLKWRMVESPASYSNSTWINDISLSSEVKNTRMDFYVPYATPGGKRYLVELTVRNESGLESSCNAEIYGLTGNSLHIELFWDNPSDVDLHLLNPEEQSLNIDNIDIEHHSLDEDLKSFRSNSNKDWWIGGEDCTNNSDCINYLKTCTENGICSDSYTNNVRRDCYFGDCKGEGIEWGLTTSHDNPRLDRDDIHGTGPENINVAQPKEGWYRVGVHYYNSVPAGTDAYVRVYCNGVVAYQNKVSLKQKDYWWSVADIYWKSVGESGTCYIFSDGEVYDSVQGEGFTGYNGNLITDIEPNNQ